MNRRAKLQEKLEAICPNVYFQPPENLKIQYPCIVYRRSNGSTKFANNKVYNFVPNYTVTVIDKNPDSEIVQKVAQLDSATLDRSFKFDNLNHDVFNIFF